MPLSYTDTHTDTGYPTQYPLSLLLSSYLEPVDPTPAIQQSLRLVHLLLLSNYQSLANELGHVLYKHTESIIPPESSSPLKYSSLALENFWLTHPEHPRPEKINAWSIEGLEKAQWHRYRECTRTGWMLEHCCLPEPASPHIWRETEEPATLAMCCRLLAKDKTEGQYASKENMKEALEAAKKLYAQPQIQIKEWKYERGAPKRHSYLLYRRLVVEIALRVGELETAAEVLALALRVDGFNDSNGGSLDEYLMLPGIWDVLPLLAKRGKEGNPYFIEEGNAVVMVKDVIRMLELRVREGRQWSLAPEKVGWEELLRRLAEGAWKVNPREYKRMGVKRPEDILFKPATEEIVAVENRFGKLPADFKEMILVANG
jgi:hypothetical protein